MPAMVIIRKCFNPDDVWWTVAGGAFTVGKGSSLFRAVVVRVVVEERSISSTSQTSRIKDLSLMRVDPTGTAGVIIVCRDESFAYLTRD